MKLQSAIEFLSTYGFLFIIMTLAILFIVFLATGAKTTVPAQCITYSVIACNFVNYYVNISSNAPYALVTFSLSNGQEVPINLTSFTTSFAGVNYTGACEPNFLYPGEEATCVSNVSAFIYSAGATADGQFTLNALVCDTAVEYLPMHNCTANVLYSGSFVTPVTNQSIVLFSSMAAVGPQKTPLPSNSVVIPPILPPGYTEVENGEWELSGSGSNILYNFGTENYIHAGNIAGFGKPQSFPASLSALNSNTVDSNALSSAPYNTLLSYSYTVIYVPAPATATYTFNSEADDAILFYLKGANTQQPWEVVDPSAGTWHILPTGSSPSLVTMQCPPPAGCGIPTTKLVGIAIAWANTKGDGLQAVSITVTG
jgi:hypothetical protein